MSDLLLSEFQISNTQLPGETAQVWWWYSKFYVDSDGMPVLWDVANPTSWYHITDCTILNNVLTVPATTLTTTTDGTPNTSLLTARVIDENGTPREYLFQNWQIPDALTPACTFATLQQHNLAVSPVNAISAYLTRQQVEIMIQDAITGSGAAKSTTAIYGVGRLNITAVDVTAPVFTGANSPQITGWASVKAIADYANLAAAVSAIGATPSQLLIPGLQTIATGTTIPSTLDVGFTVTGRWSVNSGQTVAINSHPDLAPGRQRFFGAGHTRFGTGAANTGVDLGWWGVSGDDITLELADAATSVANTSGGHIRIPTGTWINQGIALTSGVTVEGQGHTYDSSPSVTTLSQTANAAAFIVQDAFRNISFADLRINGTPQSGQIGIQATGSAFDSAFGLNVTNVVFNNLGLGVDIASQAGDWQVEDINFWNPQMFNCTVAGFRINTINSSVNSYGGNVAIPAGGVGFQLDTVGMTNIIGTKFGGPGTDGTAIAIAGPITNINLLGVENEGNEFFLIHNNSQVNAAVNFFGGVIQDPVHLMTSCRYGFYGTSTLRPDSITIDSGAAAYIVALNSPGFADALVDNSGGTARIQQIDERGAIIQGQITAFLTGAATTPLIRAVSTTADKYDYEWGQCDADEVSVNTYFLYRRDPDGYTQFKGTQTIANRGYAFDAAVEIAELATVPTAGAGKGIIGFNTAHFLQYSVNGVAPVNLISASTSMTANRLQKATANGVIANSIISDNGTTVSWTGNLSVTGNGAFSGTLSAGATTLGATSVTTLGASGTSTLAAVTATSVAVGSGTAVTKVLKGAVTVDPASINANTVASQTFTLTGAVVGDALTLNPPAAGLTAGLLVAQYFVSAANTITIVLNNTTGSPIDEPSASWTYHLTRS